MEDGQYYYTVRHSPDGLKKRGHHVLVQAHRKDSTFPGGHVYLDATATGATKGEALKGIEKEMLRHIKQRQDRLDRLQAEINDMKGWLSAMPLLEEVER